MRVVIAGGGTGGHFFPGVAVAEALRARGASEGDVLFVGTARGIEARVCPRDGLPLALIDVAGLKGAGLGGLLAGLVRLPRALFQSLAIVRRFRPDLALGVGGYASGPVLIAALLCRVPTAILEQNSIPGITNRILGRLVRAVFGSFEGSARFFPPKRFRLVGNPIRAGLRAALATGDAASQQQDAASHKIATNRRKTLLVLGGSQGAHAVNELVAGALALLAAEGRAPRVVHQTGRADREPIAARYRDLGLDAAAHEFVDDMAAAYRGADLLVARAGATTIAEVTAIGRPAIFIPLPTAADDHQTENARALERAGAATLLAQRATTPRALADAIAAHLADEPLLSRMAEASRALGRPDAADRVADELVRIAKS